MRLLFAVHPARPFNPRLHVNNRMFLEADSTTPRIITARVLFKWASGRIYLRVGPAPCRYRAAAMAQILSTDRRNDTVAGSSGPMAPDNHRG